MSQLGFAPGFGMKGAIAGAHADHKTSDYFFPRVQSLESRDLPWETRIKPIRSYSEIGAYAATFVLAGSLLLVWI